jgi:hypothetical protein
MFWLSPNHHQVCPCNMPAGTLYMLVAVFTRVNISRFYFHYSGFLFFRCWVVPTNVRWCNWSNKKHITKCWRVETQPCFRLTQQDASVQNYNLLSLTALTHLKLYVTMEVYKQENDLFKFIFKVLNNCPKLEKYISVKDVLFTGHIKGSNCFWGSISTVITGQT